GVFRQRLLSRRAPLVSAPPALPGPSGKTTELAPSFTYRLRSAQYETRERRRLLLVTPFAIYPPRHGGARRVAELVTALSADFDIILITDEARLYDARSLTHFDEMYAVHLVQRDPDPKRWTPTLGDRIRLHSHPRLKKMVEEAIRRYQPEVVQIEHIE